jgi:hypothetical protein
MEEFAHLVVAGIILWITWRVFKIMAFISDES